MMSLNERQISLTLFAANVHLISGHFDSEQVYQDEIFLLERYILHFFWNDTNITHIKNCIGVNGTLISFCPIPLGTV